MKWWGTVYTSPIDAFFSIVEESYGKGEIVKGAYLNKARGTLQESTFENDDVKFIIKCYDGPLKREPYYVKKIQDGRISSGNYYSLKDALELV
jgi:hypothetical protein